MLYEGSDNEELNKETIRIAHRYLGRGVVALDLAGAEKYIQQSSLLEYLKKLWHIIFRLQYTQVKQMEKKA